MSQCFRSCELRLRSSVVRVTVSIVRQTYVRTVQLRNKFLRLARRVRSSAQHDALRRLCNTSWENNTQQCVELDNCLLVLVLVMAYHGFVRNSGNDVFRWDVTRSLHVTAGHDCFTHPFLMNVWESSARVVCRSRSLCAELDPTESEADHQWTCTTKH